MSNDMTHPANGAGTATQGKAMDPKVARDLVRGTIRWITSKKMGLFEETKRVEWEKLVEAAETVQVIFGIQVSLLYMALCKAHNRALPNYKRLTERIPTNGFFNKREGRDVKPNMEAAAVRLDYIRDRCNTMLPGDDGFEPQKLERDDREAIQYLIARLVEIAKIAKCVKDGKDTAFRDDGVPFETCTGCHQKDLHDKEQAAEDVKIAEKRALMMPLEKAFDEMCQLAHQWVVRETPRHAKAQDAFDHEFAKPIDRLSIRVTKLWNTIPLGTPADEDRKAVEQTLAEVQSVSARIRVFKHSTWCATPGCGVPTYAWVDRKSGQPMKAGRYCRDCREHNKVVKSREVEYGVKVDPSDLSSISGISGITFTDRDGHVVAGPATPEEEAAFIANEIAARKYAELQSRSDEADADTVATQRHFEPDELKPENWKVENVVRNGNQPKPEKEKGKSGGGRRKQK